MLEYLEGDLAAHPFGYFLEDGTLPRALSNLLPYG